MAREYKVVGNANRGYTVPRELVAWVQSPEGKKVLDDAMRECERDLEVLREARRLRPEDLYSPVTI